MAGSARQRLSTALALLAGWASAAAAGQAQGLQAPLPAASIAAASAPLLDRPYRIDPLGEGATGTLDRDPLWRTDAFDCLTFVETTIALARTANATDAQTALQQLRYRDGRISFGSRNHFPDADWIPNNIASGQVRDLTAELAEALDVSAWLAQAEGIVHRRAWLQGLPGNPIQRGNVLLQHPGAAQRAELAALEQASGDQPVSIRYLRLRERSAAQLQRVIAALPDGALLFIVRPNTSLVGSVGAVTQLSHVGFVLRDAAGTAQYRNASSGRAHRVIDAPLLEYLQRMQKTRSFAGIVVLQVLAASRVQIP